VKVETVDIKDIHDKIDELNRNTANMLGRFDSHIQNGAIHQLPPCYGLRNLSNRLWGIGVLAVAGLMTAVWGVFSKGH
jgi:hypothetical protein